MADVKAWKGSGLNLRYHGVKWDSDGADQEAHEVVLDYIHDLQTNLQKGLGLVLVGPPGRGKTLLAHLIADKALDQGVSVRFQTLVGYHNLLLKQMDLMRLIERKAGDMDKSAEDWWWGTEYIDKIFKKFRLLILDDVGKEQTTDSRFIEKQFDRIMRNRGGRLLTTIITTNVPPSEWDEAFGPSMKSYLKEVCDIIPVTGMLDRRDAFHETRKRLRERR